MALDITADSIGRSYIRARGLSSTDEAAFIYKMLAERWVTMLLTHYCRFEWEFLEVAEEELTTITGGTYFPLGSTSGIMFIKSVRISTDALLSPNVLRAVDHSVYENNLRHYTNVDASTNPRQVSKYENGLYPFPMPKALAKLTISGIIDFDFQVISPTVPIRHEQALFSLVDFHLGKKTEDQYIKEIANMGVKKSTDFWGNPYVPN